MEIPEGERQGAAIDLFSSQKIWEDMWQLYPVDWFPRRQPSQEKRKVEFREGFVGI